MKKTRRLLPVLLAAAMLSGVAAFGAACDFGLNDDGSGKQEQPGNQEQPQTKYFTVTVAEYDDEQGTVTLSPTAENNSYAENSKVTVTVTPKTGFEVDSFTVNGTEEELTEGVYELTVTANTTVAATFKSVQPQTKYFTVTVAEYDDEQGTVTLSPTAENNSYAENSKVTVTVTPKTGFEVDSFTVNGTEEELTEGVYELTVTAATTIEVTFAAVPIPAELPASYYGTYYRATGSEVITINEEGFFIDETECPITSVGGVYHTTWNEGDYIVTRNPDSYSYAVLRLTYVLDEGLTEINFYEADLENDIVESAQGTWVDSAHNVTLVIGPKSLKWNGEEMELLTIGTDYYNYASIYFRKDGKVLNLFMQNGQLHCYVGNTPDSQYNFTLSTTSEEPEGPVAIPADLQGHFTGTKSLWQGSTSVSYEFEIDIYEKKINFKLNGTSTEVTEYTYSESALEEMPGVTFTVDEDSYTVYGVPDYPDYGPYFQVSFSVEEITYTLELTREDFSEEPEGPVAIPADLQGHFTGTKSLWQGSTSVSYEFEIDIYEKKINFKLNGTSTEVTEYTYSESALEEMPGVTFTVGEDSYTVYGVPDYPDYGPYFQVSFSVEEITYTLELAREELSEEPEEPDEPDEPFTGEAIPTEWQGTYEGGGHVIVFGTNSVTYDDVVAESYTVNEDHVDFVIDGEHGQLYFDSDFLYIPGGGDCMVEKK